MAEIRYGLREGPGKGREYPMAADQYISRRGGKFVYLSSGTVTLCATAAALVAGWVESPKDATSYNAWKSASTDKCYVIYGLENVFEMPCNEGESSLAITHIGAGIGIVETGATYTFIQEAKLGAVATPLSIVDVDLVNKTVFVKIKPGNLQAI